ncbi:hypothetical protein J809_2643 [Acinetobacter sp. 25977_6]|nr:hypothetical protein J811_1903 [Acinetobacter sp. 25977_8]EXT43641.1 hypothetical protein J809_2643 [Acinetobacter sp. 25977_6]EXT64126.1 hypothetical protein J804_0334 [Acinetobacter sp. 25977_1]EXT67853.1 hypothetical protein J813_2905 [Acinetobacter sp. 25977_10]KCY78870.1 hypothetical protein J732_0294 [Acinetobacter sp. 796380-1375]
MGFYLNYHKKSVFTSKIISNLTHFQVNHESRNANSLN